MKELRRKLAEAEKERKEYLEGWQRAKADYANARREEEEGRAGAIARTKERIFHDLLPVLDSFQIAMSNKVVWESVDKNWRVGVEYIYSQFVSILEEHGIRQIGMIGETFDPSLHQSVESVPVDSENDDHKILEVMQTGYTIGERVIRPARVKVGVYKN